MSIKTIKMTPEQTAAYDADDMDLIRELREQAEAIHAETGDTVEVVTADGIVALVAQD